MNYFSKFLPHIEAHAHCDVPCGIYDPTPAKIAAKTALRMIEQLEELEAPNTEDTHALNEYHGAVMRRITTKEEHAEICKHELQILWSDFFKPEHIEKFPNLHDTFWNALKLCGTNKQEVSSKHAHELVTAVDEIAKMFYEAKGAPERFKAYAEITDNLY